MTEDRLPFKGTLLEIKDLQKQLSCETALEGRDVMQFKLHRQIVRFIDSYPYHNGTQARAIQEQIEDLSAELQQFAGGVDWAIKSKNIIE